MESEERRSQGDVTELHLFYNRPTSGSVYAPVDQRLLPLDENWRRKLAELPWPTKICNISISSGDQSRDFLIVGRAGSPARRTGRLPVLRSETPEVIEHHKNLA